MYFFFVFYQASVRQCVRRGDPVQTGGVPEGERLHQRVLRLGRRGRRHAEKVIKALFLTLSITSNLLADPNGSVGGLETRPLRSNFLHFYTVFGKNIDKQVCIPVGCSHWPYSRFLLGGEEWETPSVKNGRPPCEKWETPLWKMGEPPVKNGRPPGQTITTPPPPPPANCGQNDRRHWKHNLPPYFVCGP